MRRWNRLKKHVFFFKMIKCFLFKLGRQRRCGGLIVVAIIAWENVLVIYFHNYSTGGTGDITIHEVQSDQSLHEKSMATGGPWGGNRINEAFLQIWKDTLGKLQEK